MKHHCACTSSVHGYTFVTNAAAIVRVHCICCLRGGPAAPTVCCFTAVEGRAVQSAQSCLQHNKRDYLVQWSEANIKADPCF